MSGRKNKELKKIIFNIICLITILSGNFLFAQNTIEVHGRIKDNLGNNISSIAILALDDKNSIIAYAYSDKYGKFQLKLEKKKSYLLKINGLSYKEKKIDLNVDDKVEFLNVTLLTHETILDEVFLESERAITVKKDTTIFNVDDFNRGNEIVVEDMLKNIPGVEITSDGGIKVSGREVEKVMVDYDDFFDKGYRILTKNMGSNAIDKVEILDKYSNNRLLKGIENSDKVALNLSLKEENKNVWFGNSTLGYGLASTNRYNVTTNIMSFGKKNKYYFLTSLNNTGKDVSGNLNYLVNPRRFDEPGSLGNSQNASSLINLTAQNIHFKPKRTNLNNVELFSLNSIFNLTKKVKLKILALLNTDEIDFFRNTVEKFMLSEGSFTNNENYELRKKTISGIGKIDFTYNISNNTMLDYEGKYNNERTKTNSQLLFNQIPTLEFLYEENELIDQKVVYTTKFKDNNALVFTGRYIQEQVPEDYGVNQFFYEELFPQNSETKEVSQTIKNTMLFSGMEGHYFDRKENGNLIELKGGYTSRTDKLYSTLFLESEDEVTIPQGYSNQTNYTVNDLYLKSKFLYSYKTFDFSANLSLNQYFNTLELLNKNNQKENPFYINPKFSFEWNINEKNRLSTTYSYTGNNAGILDVYNSFILTGYRHFSKGIGNFERLNATNINLYYRFGNPTDRFFAYTNLRYIKNHDFFANYSLITPDFSQTTKVLFKDREMWNASFNTENYLSAISSNLKLKAGFAKSNYQNIINLNLRSVEYLNYNYGIELRSGFDGSFNFNLGTNWQHNTVNTGVKSSFSNNTSFLNLIFIVNKDFDFEIDAERYYLGNLSRSSNTFNFLDFEGRYTFKNKFSLAIEGNNLTNTETFRNISISDISTTTTQIRLLPRYLLLKLDFRF